MNILTKVIDDSCMIIHNDLQSGVFICGSNKYIENAPLILKSPDDFWSIKTKDQKQEIVYAHDRKWTIEEAKEYLGTLLEVPDLLKDTSMLEIARYRIEREPYYSRDCLCEGHKHRNLVALSDFNCNNCTMVELPEKCAYCPIGFRCPVCSSINKENICYMHQAECIAALIISQKYDVEPGFIFQILIPPSWIKLFGDEIYNQVKKIRSTDIFNIFYHSSLVFNIKITVHKIDSDCIDYLHLSRLLSISPLRYRIDDYKIEFNIDRDTLNYLKPQYQGLEFNEEVIPIEEPQCDTVLSVRGITFGPMSSKGSVDIVDIGGQSLGNPLNLYTYSILHAMKDYISAKTECVLDIGCGRGTTSVYAKKCGAQNVDAIDIDRMCCYNTYDTIKLNSNEKDIDSYFVMEGDIFEFIKETVECPHIQDDLFDVVIGNLHYDIQKDLLPKVSSLLKDDAVYIVGGIPILIEEALLNIEHDLKLLEIRHYYNSSIIIFQKERKQNNGNLQ